MAQNIRRMMVKQTLSVCRWVSYWVWPIIMPTIVRRRNISFVKIIHLLVGLYMLVISHYCDVIMGVMASLITSLTIVYSTVHSGADQSSASLAFVRLIHRWPVNSPHKWPVTRKMFLFDDIIVKISGWNGTLCGNGGIHDIEGVWRCWWCCW